MVDLVSHSVSWNVIEGLGLFFGSARKLIAKSGLSIAFQSGRVGAIGLDFYTDQKQEEYNSFIDWTFVIKVVNPGPHGIVIEKVSAKWVANSVGFVAVSSKYNTGFIRSIFPGPTLPDSGDECLPRYIAPGATELIEVSTLLDLYHRKARFLGKKRQPYTKKNYGHDQPNDLKFTVTIKSNKGTTRLKSS